MDIIEKIKKGIRKNLDERGAEKEFYKNEFQKEFKKERLTYLKKKARKDAINGASGGGGIMGALERLGKNVVMTPPDNMFGLESPRKGKRQGGGYPRDIVSGGFSPNANALNNLFARPRPAMPSRKKRREEYILMKKPKTRIFGV